MTGPAADVNMMVRGWFRVCCALRLRVNVLRCYLLRRFPTTPFPYLGTVLWGNVQGYAMPQQTVAGLHTRLWARAFIVADPSDIRHGRWASAHLSHAPSPPSLYALKIHI